MAATQTATEPVNARGPLHRERRRVLRHRRRLRPGPRLTRAVVPLHGRPPDRPEGHLGLPAQAAAGGGPPDTGRRRRGAHRRLPPLLHTPPDHRDLDHEDSPAPHHGRLARPGLHPDWRSSPSSGRTSCYWPAPGMRPRSSTTGSSTGAVPCPCTTPGPPGSGAGGCATVRSFPSSPPGYRAWVCSPNPEKLRDDLSDAVALGTLTLKEEGDDG